MSDSNPLVRVSHVHKYYTRGGETVDVLKDLSLDIPEGDFLALMGPSGSGKSTLLNLVAGIDRPSSGRVEVEGVDLGSLSARELTLLRRDRVGFVFQFFNLIPTLSVVENVMLPAELTGTPGAERRARELLDQVGLADRAAAWPDRLSGGEQQRVGIARALMRDPRLVLADEPTGNLDDDTGEAVMELLERVTRRAERSLILVTHSAAVAARADRVLRIEHGRLAASDAAPEGVD